MFSFECRWISFLKIFLVSWYLDLWTQAFLYLGLWAFSRPMDTSCFPDIWTYWHRLFLQYLDLWAQAFFLYLDLWAQAFFWYLFLWAQAFFLISGHMDMVLFYKSGPMGFFPDIWHRLFVWYLGLWAFFPDIWTYGHRLYFWLSGPMNLRTQAFFLISGPIGHRLFSWYMDLWTQALFIYIWAYGLCLYIYLGLWTQAFSDIWTYGHRLLIWTCGHLYLFLISGPIDTGFYFSSDIWTYEQWHFFLSGPMYTAFFLYLEELWFAHQIFTMLTEC